jgi:hypothetical protein
MSWAIHYRVTLTRALVREEVEALRAVCDRHGLSLEQVWRGPDRRDEWKGLVADAEFERMKKSHQYTQPREAAHAYAGFFQLGSNKRLLAIIRWLREVETVLPTAEFEVSEDYTITEPCRPSDVNLEALEGLVAGESKKRQRKKREADADDAGMGELETASMMKQAEQELEGVERTLEEARQAFAIWKARKS